MSGRACRTRGPFGSVTSTVEYTSPGAALRPRRPRRAPPAAGGARRRLARADSRPACRVAASTSRPSCACSSDLQVVASTSPVLEPMRWPILAGIHKRRTRARSLSIAPSRRTVARREVVFHHGDPANSLHLVHSGRLRCGSGAPLGDTVMLSLLGPGEAFGEIALLDGVGPRSATVVALEKAETRAIHKIDFDALVKRHPGVADPARPRSGAARPAPVGAAARGALHPRRPPCAAAGWRGSGSPRASCP